MKLQKNNNDTTYFYPKAIASFILTFLLSLALVYISVVNSMSVEKLTMEQLIMEKSTKANEALSRLLYKTQTLATLVIQNNGLVENFEQIAATIIDDPAILNVLIAPHGKVCDVFPLEGNESVIGLDYFKEGAGNKEALLAKETKELVFGGPFDGVQGSRILVGRLPVFMDNSNGGKDFWGLVSVTLKYPDALDVVGLNQLEFQGFAYEIWRINPDNNEKQVITRSKYQYNDTTHYVEKHIAIQNADWYFRILPVRTWYEYPGTWILFFIALFVSVLVALATQNNCNLKILKSKYEKLSHTDTLTGIFNRRYFMDYSSAQIERTVRTGANAFVILMDIDHFKNINDKYGHGNGDDVLKNVVSRASSAIRSYDIFARYGGEEFIILSTDIDESDVIKLAERVLLAVSQTPINCKDACISVTASFGIAKILDSDDFVDSIERADKALYKAKEEGRNRVIFNDGRL